jgi:UDP-N-acetylmuramate--alanine ligase
MSGFERRLGISGMHGKSSCTGMCAAIFMAAETDPTVVSGAEYPAMGGYYRVGNEKNFIFEACEYKDSFLDFTPTDAIILNVELEHVDYFPSLDAVCNSFASFAALTEEKGCIFANADDDNVMRALSGHGGRVVTFGIEREADFTARNIRLHGGRPSFSLFYGDEELCTVNMRIPGLHSVYNALAASCAAYTYGIEPEAISRGLSEFSGIRRRMEYRGQKNGAAVYDDYGHHPTEIAATLLGARELTGGRLICAFQPHTYSRTKTLFDDFVAALSPADRVLLAPIYAAREPKDPDVSSVRLARAIGDKAVPFGSVAELAERVGDYLESGDVLVIMGAGDIDAACDIIKYDGENK